MVSWKTRGARDGRRARDSRRGRDGRRARDGRRGRDTSSPAELLMTRDGGPLTRLIERTDWPSTPLGPYRDWPPESTLVLYTDGLVERRREVIDAGIQRVCDALEQSRSLSPEQVADHLSALVPGDAHADDVALLVYRQPASG